VLSNSSEEVDTKLSWTLRLVVLVPELVVEGLLVAV